MMQYDDANSDVPPTTATPIGVDRVKRALRPGTVEHLLQHASLIIKYSSPNKRKTKFSLSTDF